MKKHRADKRVLHVAVTPEQRYHMINNAAYFRAIKHQQETGEDKDLAESWCEVQAEIDAVLNDRHAG